MGTYFFTIFVTCFVWSAALAESDFHFEKIVEKSGFSKNKLGISISKNGKSIFSINPNQKFIPASLSKILTASAATKVFSPGRRFKTELVADATIEGSILNGKLYIKGGGDPSLVSETMWVLVNHFLRSGIKKIQGPIVVDNTIYDEQFVDSSREDARVDRAYDSPVSATPFNWNTLSIYVRPGSKDAEPVRVIMDPETDFFKIKNEAKTRTANGSTLEVVRKGKDIIITGKLGVHTDEKVFYKNIDDPVQWAGQALLSFLEQRGVQIVDKKIVAAKAPEKAVTLSDAEGWDIEEIISGLMRFSNNFIAEMITKNMAIERGAKQGSVSEGIKVIKSVLSDYGIAESSYDFENPSGLSRENKITSETLVKILNAVRTDFTTAPEFLNAMAVPGVDGSLHKRMKNVDEKRWIRAKTGLLTGAVGLAGYVGKKSGEVYEFAFMYNGGGKEDLARALFDELAQEIATK